MKTNSKNIDADFYENNDLSAMMVRDSAKVAKPMTQRITINISMEIYNDAHKLDAVMGMGYQNVIKTAILLGMRDLREIINQKNQ